MIDQISYGYDYDEDGKTLIARPEIAGCGLFSAFCLMLSSTTACRKKTGSVPEDIKFNNGLSLFQEPGKPAIDIYRHAFKIDPNVQIDHDYHVGPDNHHTVYNNTMLTGLQPFFRKYFSLNDRALEVKSKLESRYNITDNNRLSVIYRASDKWTDFGGTISIGPAAYYRLAREIFDKEKSSGIKTFIQTEDQGVVTWYKNSMNSVFLEETRVGQTDSTTRPIPASGRHEWLLNYIAALYIHGESNHLITYTGNSGYFAALAHGNTNNLYQDTTFSKNCKEFFNYDK